MNTLAINYRVQKPIVIISCEYLIKSILMGNIFYYIFERERLSNSIMPKDEINNRLQELAKNIQENTFHSPKERKERRKAFTEFWELLINHPYIQRIKYQKLWTKHKQELGRSFDECFEEALAKVNLEITEKIDNYNSEFGTVWNWFRFLLEKRFLDTKNEYLNFIKRMSQGEKILIIHKSLYTPVTNQKGEQGSTTEKQTYLDILPANSKNKPLSIELIEILEKDEGDIFKSRYVRNKPHINYQDIALKRGKGKSWKDIETEMNINFGTVTSFFDRAHVFFQPIISEYLLGEVIISKSTQEVIIADVNNYLKKKKIKCNKKNTLFTFQELMLLKLKQKSWQQLLTQINDVITYKELVYFYLKSINQLSDIFTNEFNL